MRTRALLLILALITPSCFLSRRTINEPLSAERIGRLVPGTTTARECVELLGAPTEVVQLAKRSAYRFDHAATKETGVFLLVLGLYNSDTRADRAWLFFDENEVLTHVATDLRANQVDFNLPFGKDRVN
jgi:hypothetical protein